MILFLDPLPYVPSLHLERRDCDGCGGSAYARGYYDGPVRCAACWSAFWGTDPMRPIAVPPRLRVRYAGGKLPGPPAVAATASRCRVMPSPVAGAPLWRVLIAARAATPSETPPAAAALATLGHPVTYALAEERATGRLIHSVAVRARGRGYVVYLNGRFASARIDGRAMGGREALAVLEGRPYAPPAPRTAVPMGPCPRCAQTVRWRSDGPYRHKRDEAGQEGGRAAKVPCE